MIPAQITHFLPPGLKQWQWTRHKASWFTCFTCLLV